MTFSEYIEKVAPDKLKGFQKSCLQNMENEIRFVGRILMVPKVGQTLSKYFILNLKNNWYDFDNEILNQVNK